MTNPPTRCDHCDRNASMYRPLDGGNMCWGCFTEREPIGSKYRTRLTARLAVLALFHRPSRSGEKTGEQTK